MVTTDKIRRRWVTPFPPLRTKSTPTGATLHIPPPRWVEGRHANSMLSEWSHRCGASDIHRVLHCLTRCPRPAVTPCMGLGHGVLNCTRRNAQSASNHWRNLGELFILMFLPDVAPCVGPGHGFLNCIRRNARPAQNYWRNVGYLFWYSECIVCSKSYRVQLGN
jgi:hypothetical protein